MTLAQRKKVAGWFRFPLFVISLAGMLGSLAAHIESVRGVDPRQTFKDVWLFQLLLLVVLIPIVIEIFKTRSAAKPA